MQHFTKGKKSVGEEEIRTVGRVVMESLIIIAIITFNYCVLHVLIHTFRLLHRGGKSFIHGK
jgi:hypothetical protein